VADPPDRDAEHGRTVTIHEPDDWRPPPCGIPWRTMPLGNAIQEAEEGRA